MSVTFNYFHANIKSNPLMAQSKVDFDLARVRRLGRNGGFNEIAPLRYKLSVKRLFKKAYNLTTESPQVINPNIFRYIRSYNVTTHGGVASMTPTRKVCVTLTQTVRGGHFPVAFVESHYINKGVDKPIAIRDPERRKKLHQKHFEVEQQIVLELVAAGFTVVGSEDTNQSNMPKYIQSQHWIHNHGIDKMWIVPAKDVEATIISKEVVTDTHTFLNTDHPALVARTKLSRV